jgi:hypothetical protein
MRNYQSPRHDLCLRDQTNNEDRHAIVMFHASEGGVIAQPIVNMYFTFQ